MRGKEAFAPATSHTSGYSAIKLIKRTKERKISMQRPQPIRFLLIVLVALFALAPHAAVFAGQPVDTSRLNPVPPSFLTCKAVGNDTICQGDRTVDYDLIDTA